MLAWRSMEEPRALLNRLVRISCEHQLGAAFPEFGPQRIAQYRVGGSAGARRRSCLCGALAPETLTVAWREIQHRPALSPRGVAGDRGPLRSGARRLASARVAATRHPRVGSAFTELALQPALYALG